MNYVAHYAKLIDRARHRAPIGYVERHHVLPRCIGGDDSPQNIVALTAEEHYVAHQLLIKIYPKEWRLVYPAIFMARRATNNKAYGWIQRRRVAAIRGAPYSDERRAKISAALKGRRKSESQKAKQRAAMLGRTLSPQARAKVSASLMGNKRTAGRALTPEHKAAISAAGLGNKYSLGVSHTAATRAKMSEQRRGKRKPPRTAAHTANFVASRWGKKPAPTESAGPRRP